MSVREAYKIMLRHEIKLMDWMNLTAAEIEALIEDIHQDENFHQELARIVEDAVEISAFNQNISLEG